MIDFFDICYSSLRNTNKFHSFLRYLIRNISNVLIPFYFKLTKRKVILPEKDKANVIVSLTSFPQRISKIWLIIECILRQKTLPNKIILWLAKDQFSKGINDLPENLKYYLKKNILEVIFLEEDFRSHKKYYYAFKEFPDDIIITLDDDIFYPSNIISDLLELHKKYPDVICCHRAHMVLKDNDNKLKAYTSWEKIYDAIGPTFKIFHTSGGGTLYKKSMFTDEVLNDKIFRDYCFYADDIWLNIMAQISKTKTIKSNYFSHLIPIFNSNSDFKLSLDNVIGGKNDEQIQNLIKYYKLEEKNLF